MLATQEDVTNLTGYEVTLEHIAMAQAIIETMVGKTEGEFKDPTDLLNMGRAVCYQAAYVSANYETVFEQIGVRAITQTDSTLVLDVGMASPHVAPLAWYALRNLTNRASKSIKTGSMFGTVYETPWELD